MLRFLPALGLFLAAIPAWAAHPAIPKPFWGRWNPTPAKCDVGPPVDEVRIERDGAFFWEWSHEPIAIQPAGPDGIRIKAWLYESDGADDPNKPSGKVTVIVKLLADGKRISYQVDGERPFVYVKCSGKRKDQNW